MSTAFFATRLYLVLCYILNSPETLFTNKIQKIQKIRHNSPDFFGNMELLKKEQKMNIENLRNMALHI